MMSLRSYDQWCQIFAVIVKYVSSTCVVVSDLLHIHVKLKCSTVYVCVSVKIMLSY